MKNLVLLLLIISAVNLSSCKKAKQNKLIGSWKLLPVIAADTSVKQIYTFDAANILYRTTQDTIVDTANYLLVKEFTRYYVDITDLDQYNDAHYYIEKLNNTVLILQSYDPFLRKEFVKVLN